MPFAAARERPGACSRPTKTPPPRRRGGETAWSGAGSDDPVLGFARALGLGLGAVDLDLHVELGVLLRPLGNVIYAMPPACTTDEQCDRIAAAMNGVIEA